MALMPFVPLVAGDRVLEPFAGENNFYDAFPTNVVKGWCEIRRGRDYKDCSGEWDWVITNPPYRLSEGTTRVNAFYQLLDYYSTRAKKGIAFLANDRCFSTLTPRRLGILRQRGWSLHKVVVCSVKKWRGRYFFLVFRREDANWFTHLPDTYE